MFLALAALVNAEQPPYPAREMHADHEEFVRMYESLPSNKHKQEKPTNLTCYKFNHQGRLTKLVSVFAKMCFHLFQQPQFSHLYL